MAKVPAVNSLLGTCLMQPNLKVKFVFKNLT
jgi:hypothetical protein